MRFALRSLAALALVFIGPLGCEPALVVNERFVPTTVGIVNAVEGTVIDRSEGVRFDLADGDTIEVVFADLDPFRQVPVEGDLLLTGRNASPWIIGASGMEGAQSECFGLGLRAFDRGSTIEIEMETERGLFLVVPKAPGYRDHGTKADGEVLQRRTCLDDQGRALGPDFQFHMEDVDVEPPASVAGPLDPVTTEAWTRVDCVATDDHGVHSMQLWRRFRAQEGDPWGAWEQILTQDACPFAIWLDAGIGFYEFATVAVDEAWNKEPLPAVGDAAIQRLPGPDPSPSPSS